MYDSRKKNSDSPSKLTTLGLHMINKSTPRKMFHSQEGVKSRIPLDSEMPKGMMRISLVDSSSPAKDQYFIA